MDNLNSLPVLSSPHDALRNGLSCLKADAGVAHPVEAVQKSKTLAGEVVGPRLLRDVYGTAASAKLDIERQILLKTGRFHGLHSSRLGLDSLTGELDELTFEDFLGDPQNNEMQPPDMHSQFEAHFGTGVTQKRGFF
uniref:Proteasome maturation protein n=1 Tax=Tetraselmis sp. GSL018 TaxID=582737 RepID=A0A061SPY4_9CHLO